MTVTLVASFRKSPPVDLQPVVDLVHWCFVLTPSETVHFAGVLGEGGCFRISSPVVMFDTRSLAGKTISGRHYQLVGDPAGDTLRSVMLSLVALRIAPAVDRTATDTRSRLLAITSLSEISRFRSSREEGWLH